MIVTERVLWQELVTLERKLDTNRKLLKPYVPKRYAKLSRKAVGIFWKTVKQEVPDLERAQTAADVVVSYGAEILRRRLQPSRN